MSTTFTRSNATASMNGMTIEKNSKVSTTNGVTHANSKVSTTNGVTHVNSKVSTTNGVTHVNSKGSTTNGVTHVNSKGSTTNGVTHVNSKGSTTNGVTHVNSNGSATNGVQTPDITNGFHSAKKRYCNGVSEAHSNGTLKAINGQVSNPSSRSNSGHRDLSFLKCLSEVIIKEAIEEGLRPESKVVDFHHPKELKSLVDLTLNDEPTGDGELLEICSKVIKYSVKSGHENFYNQLFGGFNMYGLGGAWLTEALNTSQYTYEVAPLFTLMEKEVFKAMRSLIGFQSGDGIFCPGGSISNMYAVSLARFKMFPEVKTKGMQGIPPICVFTSEQSHYSLRKGAAFLGLGLDSVITVKCDSRGKMIPDELRNSIDDAISQDITTEYVLGLACDYLKNKTLNDTGKVAVAQGFTPILVNATAATTVLGAYDPIEEICDVCEQYGIWLHVDGAWGGGALLSRKHRHLMKGIHRVDSMTWNQHKMMGAPLQCSAFLTRHQDLLDQCHSAKAQYLFQQDKFYDVSYDTGDKSVQCGRKVDVLKLWLLWKAKGNTRFEEDIDNVFDCARYLVERIRKRPGFKLVLAEPECTNVCFWYIPPRLQGQPESPEWWAEIAKVAPEIKRRMMMEGTVLVGYQPLGDKVNFFRMVIPNLETTPANMDFFVAEVERLGHDL